MPLRIACDLDGTLADMDAALQAEAVKLFGADVDLKRSLRARPEGNASAENPDPTSAVPSIRSNGGAVSTGVRLSTRQQRQLWAHVQQIENFWMGLKEHEPGAVARLARAAAAHAWEVLFITTRPSSAGLTTQVQSQRWLEAHGFQYPSVYVVPGSRGRVAAALALDVVIDDRPENCLDVVAESEASSMLVWRDGPETVPSGAARLGIEVVFSVHDALAQLEARRIDEPAGILDRVKDALGL